MSQKSDYNTHKYFNNNDKGISSPHEVDFPDLNIKVDVYYHNLKTNKIGQMEDDIREAVKSFKESFGLEKGSSEKVLKMYVFDDKDDYSHLGSKDGLGDEGGKAYYRGAQDAFAEMYVYQAGGIHNLKHELAHGLTYVATEGRSLPIVLMEGIAEYIEHSSGQSVNTMEGLSIDAAERAIGKRGLDIDSILKLGYSENAVDNSLAYKMGHALTIYLKDQGILANYLEAVKEGNTRNAESLIRSNYDQEKFTSWLSKHNTENVMKEVNALQITKGDFIATNEEIIDGETKNVSYYKANIEKMDGDKVGQFSTTSHYSQGNTLRVESLTSRADYLNLSEKFNFIKLVNHNGITKLAYCDKYGNEYKDSQEYRSQVTNIVNKHSGKIGQKIVEELTYFDPGQVRSTGYSSIEHFKIGQIFSVQSDGASAAKTMNGLSIYDGKNKVGELLTESGYFAKVEGSNKDTFFFADDLMGLQTKYDDGAYIAVTKENGKFTASLVESRTVDKDGYYNEQHLHRNELLKPSINHISKVEGLKDGSLLLKGTKFLDHSESKVAKIDTLVKRGELLDNKGTERTEDDVYEAKIEQDDFMYKFQNKGFYISKQGDFFIHDHGKNVRYQLPKEITHLKLVKKDGVDKLVPVTKGGNEHPHGMPSNMPDEYRYIDPIFAHEYTKKDYSHKHVNVGLINFDKYKPDTMFLIKHDPSENSRFFTKVKLFDEHDQEIGMLSNNFHNYTSKIFFSVDYNYSYTDFLASVAPQVNTENKFDKELGKWTKVITFDQGKGDIGGTDRGYTDYQKIYTQGNQNQHTSIEKMQRDAPTGHKHNNQFSNKNAEFKKAINDGDIIIYKVKGDSLSDTTFEMVKRSKVANANNEYEKNVTLNSEKFDINKVVHQEGAKSGGQLFYVLNKNSPDKSGFYNFGQDKFKLSSKYLEDPKFKYTYHDNDYLGDMLLSRSNPGNDVNNDVNVGSTSRDVPVVYALHDKSIQKDQPRDKRESVDVNNKDHNGQTSQSYITRSANNKDVTIAEELHPNAQKTIVLNFRIEKNENTGKHQFVLIENSKKLVLDALGGDVQFKNLDLPENFSVWYNDEGYRHEVMVKNSNGYSYNHPINHHGISVEVSSDGSKIIDHGFYPLAILHNPDYYENVRAQYKNPSGLNDSKFLQDIQNNLFNKANVFTQISNAITTREDREAEAQIQAEKEFNRKNIELEKAIDNGDIVLYKVKEGGHSSAILEMTKESQKALGINHEDSKNIKLDPSKFYTRENKAQDDPHAGKYLYSVKEYIHEGYDDLFYALNKNDPSKSGFYNLGKDKFIFPAKYLQTEPNKYIYDDDLHHKLLSNLEQSNNDVMLGDGPQIAKVSSNAIEKEVILKDTILTIGKSRTSDEHGRHKAEIKIEHSDIKSLLDSASSREEQHSILKFWHKLAENGYKIGDLSDQYYFKDGNFVMHESNGQCIKLPENAISLKLMNLNGNLELVVLNKAGEVVGNIHEVNSLSYGLLSDSDTLSHLETTDFQLSEMQSDYDHHLINGLGGEIFQNCHHDNMLI